MSGTDLLDYHNVLLKSIMTEAIVDQQPVSKIDQRVSDFDNVTFHISTYGDDKEHAKILVSLALKAWPDLEKYGVESLLAREYGNLVHSPAEDGYNFSLLIDPAEYAEAPLEVRTETVAKIAMLRRNALAAPFEEAFKAFDRMSAEEGPDPALTKPRAIHYRDEESFYIVPNFDRVTVIFSTIFRDETDQVLGKVFLQEFVDARKRAVQSSPQVIFSKEAPLELKGERLPTGGAGHSFITFVLFPEHISKQRRENCISHIQTFRDYFHYHIKCSKAFVHTRMRYRTGEFLKVLNRAKPENAN